jgi:O-antigen/teichoic acid export membrane protein
VTSADALAHASEERRPDSDLRRFVLTVGPTGAAALLQLATFALTARSLGPETFGLLAVVYGVAVIATDVAGLGADTAMVRDAALDPARFARAWGHALTLMLLSYLPVALAATAAAAWLSMPTFGLATVAALVFGEILAGRTTAAVELAMVAHGDAVRSGLVRLATAAARALTATLVFGLLGRSSASLWACATLAQSIALAAALLFAVARIYPAAILGIDRQIVRFGLLLMLNNLSRSLNGNIDRIILSSILAPVPLGIYASSTRLQLLGGIMNQAATRIFYPRFFRAAAGGAAPLRELTRAVAGRMALVGLLSLALIAAAAQALPLILGPAYSALPRIATGLAVASPFIALQYPPADALTASGRQALRTAIYLAAAAASAGLLAFGALLAGVWGAVVAFVLVQVALAAALWLVFLRPPRAPSE